MKRDWGGYGALMDEASAIAAEERKKQPVDCPVCGTVLDYNARLNQLNCPMGHFRTTALVEAGRP